MTYEQFNILIEDGDLLPEHSKSCGQGLFFYDNYVCKLSGGLYDIFCKCFEIYSRERIFPDGICDGSLGAFIDFIESRLNDIYLTNEQQKEYLTYKKIEEDNKQYQLLKELPSWFQTCENITKNWPYALTNDQKAILIIAAKFTNKTHYSFPFGSLTGEVWEIFSESNDLQRLIEVLAIQENIKYLQEKINHILNPRNSTLINTIFSDCIAMVCYYKGIQVKQKNITPPGIISLGYSRPKAPDKLYKHYSEFKNSMLTIDNVKEMNTAVWGHRKKHMLLALDLLLPSEQIQLQIDIDKVNEKLQEK